MYKLRLVRERTSRYGRVRDPFVNAQNVFERFRETAEALDREVVTAVLLNTKNRAVGLHEVSVGTLSSALLHPREVFKAAILANAAAILLWHNHPSGDPAPSSEDRRITARLRDAAEIIGIALLDHVIIGADAYYSFADHGWEEK